MRTSPSRAIAEQHVATVPAGRQAAPTRGGLAATLRGLHRTCGNRFVQRLLAAATQEEMNAPSDVQEAIRQTQGSGQPLRSGVRVQMESAFGADFSSVRLHTDANADALNRSLSAVAFTTGRDIYFREGAYDPDGAGGRRLLAHELTHVAQQDGRSPGGNLVVGAPGDVYEQEADQVAEAVAHTLEHPAPRDSPGDVHAHPASIQRMCTHCEEEREE